jgi:hypothetical protein
MTESDLQRQVIELAQWHKWLVFHPLPAMHRGRWVTATQGDTGFPDLVLARRGVVLFRELKTDTGRLSPAQQRWAEHLPDWGVWRPRDLDAIRDELRGVA